MRYLPVLCLLLATLTWGQQQPVSAPTDVPPDNDEQSLPASASRVAADAPVITIHGLCGQPAPQPAAEASSTPCQTLISRAQFERLTDAILPNRKASLQQQLANSYPNLLAMVEAAEARGLEKSPRYIERLAFARLQILSQELVRQIDEESSHISDKDIEDYYDNHAAAFRTATLERIFVPSRKRADPPLKEQPDAQTANAQRKESEDAMTRVATELRVRAAAGEPFMTLQKQAYSLAGMSDVPPNPSLGQVRVADLPPGHSSVLDLKPGEVSKVLSDSTGHYIYKLDSKETSAMDKTKKEEIRGVLRNQRKEKAIQAIQQPLTTELNPVYFGASEKSSGAADSEPK